MELRYRPPYLGVAYYPEDWPEEEMANDIAKMKDAGINVARVGEFAWSKMEPREGEFHFEWLHRVIASGRYEGAGERKTPPARRKTSLLLQQSKLPRRLRTHS